MCGNSWFPVSELSARLRAKSNKNPVTKQNEYQREYAVSFCFFNIQICAALLIVRLFIIGVRIRSKFANRRRASLSATALAATGATTGPKIGTSLSYHVSEHDCGRHLEGLKIAYRQGQITFWVNHNTRSVKERVKFNRFTWPFLWRFNWLFAFCSRQFQAVLDVFPGQQLYRLHKRSVC